MPKLSYCNFGRASASRQHAGVAAVGAARTYATPHTTCTGTHTLCTGPRRHSPVDEKSIDASSPGRGGALVQRLTMSVYSERTSEP
jgi:hypothetical protein